MSVLIVTHCYAKRLPQYAAMLRAQLWSLETFKPKIPVIIDVHYVAKDYETERVLGDYAQFKWVNDVVCNLPQMTRRAIGRNISAIWPSEDDVVWFTDVDYLFGPGCLDALHEHWKMGRMASAGICYPKTVKVHKDHATGDRFTAAIEAAGPIELDEADFTPTHYRKAIGGIQIVSGADARKYGYLAGNKKWQTPRDCEPFSKHCRDDRIFRGECLKRGPSVALDIPNVYRLRHSEAGHGKPIKGTK